MHRWFTYSAGEWGKSFINAHGNYEENASTLSLVNCAMKIDSSLINGIKVYEEYDHGNKDIIKLVHNFYEEIALGLVNVIYTLNPDHIIIGGGITNRGDDFLEGVKTAIKPHLWSMLS